jgi:hypothetical protein
MDVVEILKWEDFSGGPIIRRGRKVGQRVSKESWWWKQELE